MVRYRISAFRPQCLRRIDPERASQRHRARRESYDQHDAVRGKEQQYVTHRSEAQQRSHNSEATT